MQKPIEIEITRGKFIESVHRVHCMIIESTGKINKCWGDEDLIFFPRSSIKPLQALLILESGCADHYQISDQEIAIACGSHNGESNHIQLVTDWLQKVGLNKKNLLCGAHPPLSLPTYHEMLAQKTPIESIHNTCSGKHTGMLSVAKFFQTSLDHYMDFDHPVQQRIKDILSDFMGSAFQASQYAIDGCSVPTWATSLKQLALAAACFGYPAKFDLPRQQACKRIHQAMIKHPYYVAGSNRIDTEIMEQCDQCIIKVGAEGVFWAALPNRQLGIALKAEDGSDRAAKAAIIRVLKYLNVIPKLYQSLDKYIPIIKNHNNMSVGITRVIL